MTTNGNSRRKPSSGTHAAVHADVRRPDLQRAELEGCAFQVWRPLPKSVHYPTLARRFGATAIDFVVGLPIVLFVVVVIDALSGFALYKLDLAVRAAMLSIVVYAVYFAYWESSATRATPGKILLDMRVSARNGEPLSFADAMIRFFLRVATAATLNAGLWLAWRDSRGRALHDRLCKTVVIAYHVDPGKLRVASRVPTVADMLAAIVGSILAYGAVFDVAPDIARNLANADRFDAAIAALAPAFAGDGLTGRDAQRTLRSASEALDEIGLRGTIDRDLQGVVIRATDEGSGRRDRDESSVVLKRETPTDHDAGWSCRMTGFAWYALPRQCRPDNDALVVSEASAASRVSSY